ncbi:3-deoxy-7-phosphoheptulonate synthase [Denitrobaculum tricleocarpae]|uniref:Phospho-2-dehydro-3-deoxyheptonate aldolase n=1 Tax=Denitrobaculum tricleocarpae TaxID=2591009 RepID=A0A545TTP5_9PROT|nr:3-deoxy-7-phosphoheptulonate synthase [Denitrobaculum tricleocarpae]TQV80594.1 3-deoxy-7-phosphoheptulonate synthase [Denitrobaculum tricleocarpae]
MQQTTDDLRIKEITELVSPEKLLDEIPLTPETAKTVRGTRTAIQRILKGQDDRLLVVVGPCSIHDPEAALDYAQRLSALRLELAGSLEVVMRVYFEKPRTTVGWKGLINDPHLDGSFDINSGLAKARRLLAQINEMGVPVGCEFLDTTVPQYISDQVSWAAIGARTTESQIHRELASGLSCPVGFKNGTSGDIKIALDAVQSAAHAHHFMAVTKTGRCAIAATTGNEDCHMILRGGAAPNYDAGSVDAACRAAEAAGQRGVVMIDTSHANSAKKPENQPLVAADIADQIAGGERRILGLLIESHLVAGRQDLTNKPLKYGQSVTDGCIDWATTIDVLYGLAEAVSGRRRAAA